MKRALLALLAACSSEDKDIEKRPAPAPVVHDQVPPPTVTCSKALPAPVDPRERAETTGIVAPRPLTRAVVLTPTVRGDLDAAVVAVMLRRHQARFQACFEERLAAFPMLTGGIVETAFAIQPSGQVASPTADGVDPAVTTCIRTVLQRIAFPAPGDRNQVQVSVRIAIRHTPPGGTDPLAPKPSRAAREWTPFAAIEQPADPATQTITGATAAVRDRVPAIDSCFDGTRGVARAMLAIDPVGRVSAIRVGGLGDSGIERCVSMAIGSITTAAGPRVEIACDIVRGGAAPLRVSPDAGYNVIEVTATEARNGSSARTLPPRGQNRSVTAIGTSSSVLVLAEPDAPAHGLEYALWWAPAGPTLVAVKASGGGPAFLGMGDSRAARLANSPVRAVQLRTDQGRMRACVPGEQLDASASLLDPKAMDAVMAVVASTCQRAACAPTVIVGTSGDFVAKELVATTSAARRAGFATLSIGGPACD